MGSKHSVPLSKENDTVIKQRGEYERDMSVVNTSNLVVETGKEIIHGPPEISQLERKITSALKELHRVRSLEEKESHNPFTRIMLKFPLVEEAFNSVRSTFEALDKEKKGYIVFNEMEGAFEKLGINFSKEEIGEVFQESDMRENGKLDFKEFLGTCILHSDLDHAQKIPSLETEKLSIFYAPMSPKDAGAPSQSILFGEGNKLRIAFQLAVDAFLWFDVDGDGYINRDEMALRLGTSMHAQSPTKKMSNAHEKGAQKDITESVNSIISERRFNEMDWNHDGTIHFKEFLMAFESWVGVDDE